MTLGLNDLNRRVTEAIFRAEALTRGSVEAEQAFREVAELEEEIAAICGADTLQGAIARLGAVTASMSAGELVRTVELAERYLAHELSDRCRIKLQALHDEAEATMASAPEPNVHPVRFTLQLENR